MNILYLLVAVSLLIALIFLGLFIWAIKSGQYDDLQTPSMRVLFEDDNPEETNNETTSSSTKKEKEHS